MIVVCRIASSIQLYFIPAPVNDIMDCFQFDYSGAIAIIEARPA